MSILFMTSWLDHIGNNSIECQVMAEENERFNCRSGLKYVGRQTSCDNICITSDIEQQ